jgi:hypothetical protein
MQLEKKNKADSTGDWLQRSTGCPNNPEMVAQTSHELQ